MEILNVLVSSKPIETNPKSLSALKGGRRGVPSSRPRSRSGPGLRTSVWKSSGSAWRSRPFPEFRSPRCLILQRYG